MLTFRASVFRLASPLAALLLAALLAAAPATFAAEIGPYGDAEPDRLADFTACLGAAQRSAGFDDTDGIVAEESIDCIHYYGITVGKTETRFDPGSPVTRSQMALFLRRAADAAGVRLGSSTGDGGFADVAGLDAERLAAIVALSRAGVLEGRSPSRFEPHEPITRSEMVVALIGFLRLANPDLFYASGDRAGELILDTGEELDYFYDARRTVPRDADSAISYAYELGITTGAGNGSEFLPEAPVLRKQMASFIARTLAHTSLRPAGLTAQHADGRVVASLRDSDFRPVRYERIDAFYASAGREYRVFSSSGGCAGSGVRTLTGGTCTIDAGDPTTGGDGDAVLGSLPPDVAARGATIWAWTGARGDRFSSDTSEVYRLVASAAERAREPAAAQVPATALVPAFGFETVPQQRFGSVYEVVMQLKSGSGEPTLRPDTSVGSDGRNPAEYRVTIRTFNGRASTPPALDGQYPAGVGPLVSQQAPMQLSTDSRGRLRFQLTAQDPDPAPTVANYRTVQYEVIVSDNAPPHADGSGVTSGWIIFSDG